MRQNSIFEIARKYRFEAKQIRNNRFEVIWKLKNDFKAAFYILTIYPDNFWVLVNINDFGIVKEGIENPAEGLESLLKGNRPGWERELKFEKIPEKEQKYLPIEHILDLAKKYGWNPSPKFHREHSVDIALTHKFHDELMLSLKSSGHWWIFNVTFSSLPIEQGRDNFYSFFEGFLKSR